MAALIMLCNSIIFQFSIFNSQFLILNFSRTSFRSNPDNLRW